MKNNFKFGARDGIAIALGYIAVSFSFGMTASAEGLPVWVSVGLSALNMTSAGQFAALTAILTSAPLAEIALSTLVINIRYLLMSLVLSQRLVKMPLHHRLAVSFGITDEIFTVSSTKPFKVTTSYMLGLITIPYLGWVVGTLLGALAGNLLGEALSTALGIGLYAMFVAIVLPVAKKEKPVAIATLTAIAIACIFRFTPMLSSVSAGLSVIIASVAAAALAAVIFPGKNETTT